MNSKTNDDTRAIAKAGAKDQLPADRDWTKSAAQLPARFEYDSTQTMDVDPLVLKNNGILSTVEPNQFTNAYKIMRTQILQKMRSNGWNTVGITSPGRGEGKSLTSINLAISLAMEVNYTVLLIDADMRHPSITSYLGINAKKGLSNCLIDKFPVSDLLVNPKGIDRFVILPGGTPIHNAGEILSSHMMVDFVEEVKSRYPSRIVIFDLPPTLVAGESLAIAPYLDTNILVAESGKTRNQDLVRAIELLAPANLMGTVLTKSKEKIREF